MSLSVHVEGDRQLVADLAAAPNEFRRELRQSTSKGALNIKKDWARRWTGLGRLPHLPRAISYDLDVSDDGLEVSAEIGADRDRLQGNMAHFMEYGTVNNAPRPAGMAALLAEAGRYEQALGDIAVRVLLGGGR